MEYNQEAIKQASDYTKYIHLPEIIDLVSSINNNETDFNVIKKLLIDCLNNQLQRLPIESDVLKQNVFTTFCLMLKNTETRIIHFGILKISYNTNSTPRKPTIPAITTIAKLYVDEWIQSYENNMLDIIDLEENDNKTNQRFNDSDSNQQNSSMNDYQKISSISKIDIIYKGWRDRYDRWCVGSLEQVTHLYETEYPIYENGHRGEFNKSTIGFSTVEYQVEFEKYEIELIPANSPIFDIPKQESNPNAYSIHYYQYYSDIDEYKIVKNESKQLAKGIVGYVFVKLNEGFYSNFHIQIPPIGTAEFYQFFFDKQFDAFKLNRHDAWRDDLINEFLPVHIDTEKDNIKQSNALFEYFPQDERNTVLVYVNSYFEYLNHKFSNIIKQENPNNQQQLQNDISDQVNLKSQSNQENAVKPPPPKYDPDLSFLEAIYNHCHDQIFTCDKLLFFQMVSDADFSKLTIKNISKTKKLITHIHKYLPKNWYKEAANSLGWEPSDCSGSNVEKSNPWMAKLSKIQPKAM